MGSSVARGLPVTRFVDRRCIVTGPGPRFSIPLAPETEVPDDKAVPGKELAGRAIAVQFFPGRGRGCPPGAEEEVRLIFFESILFIGRAGPAVLPADLTVLFRIIDSFFTGFHKGKIGVGE
jgi:hypothetical protein